MNFVAIDFETANSNRSSICSVGIAIVEKGKIVASEHIYVRPVPDYYDRFNTRLHGIDSSITKNEKTFKQHWKELRDYFKDQTIVAHNAAFDFSVLRSALDESKLAYPNLDYHCTYRLTKESLLLPSHKLDVVSKHFKIKLKHHNAESDAIAAAKIAIKLCKKHKANSLEELSEKLGFSIGKIESKSKGYKAFSKKNFQNSTY
ncbi:MAG: 3'-5' exonuclease [Bacteroidetes bacterium]|nr:3'-5' exonuclease [Bacteroidota bacterium]